MATNLVNLDALIIREDLSVRSDRPPSTRLNLIRTTDLEAGNFFYGSLRKPDFQRETSNWSPQKIVEFLKTFVEDELIPAVILWDAGENVFVIDGAHRLSALIAWVQDDYGDKMTSLKFFENNIPAAQIKAAEETRTLIAKEIGSYAAHKVAMRHPETSRFDIAARAKRLGILGLELQTVKTPASEKAEEAFFKINQETTPIDPTELTILRARKSANAIAARAIIRSGTGHNYWSHFSDDAQTEIKKLASEVYNALYEPQLETPIKTLDLPVAGRGYAAQTLPLVFDLVNLANDIKTPPQKKANTKKNVDLNLAEDNTNYDADGTKTIRFLGNTLKLVNRICGTHASSLGLHPALYFYGQSGNYQPSAFLGMAMFIKWLGDEDKWKEFTEARARFEKFLLVRRTFITEIVHKLGGRERSIPWIKTFYEKLLGWISSSGDQEDIMQYMKNDPDFSFLLNTKPTPESNTNKDGQKFHRKTKSAVFLNQALEHPNTCNLCGGLLHRNAITTGHIQDRSAKGSADFANGQTEHPYCNSTFKGSQYRKLSADAAI